MTSIPTDRERSAALGAIAVERAKRGDYAAATVALLRAKSDGRNRYRD